MRTLFFRCLGLTWFGIGAVTSSLIGQVSHANAQVPPAKVEGPWSTVPPPGVTFPPAPPPGFNPLSATDAELRVLGFPPRPDASKSPEAYARWSKVVSASKFRIAPVVKQTQNYHGPARILGAPAVNATNLSTNWSGAADYYSSGAPFLGVSSFVYGEWVIPLAQQAFGTCTGGWEYSSQWVGLDGLNSSDVMQAGSEADAYCSGGTTSSDYYLWFEWYPNTETAIGLTINPGDVVAVYVWYIGNNVAGAYWLNYTTNQAAALSFSAPAGTTYTGSSIDWIVEAPTVSGSPSSLANYTAVPWNNTFGYSSTTGLIYEPSFAPGTNGNAYTIEMVTDVGSTQYVISACTTIEYVDMMWCNAQGPAVAPP
jgi:hypothetical protein